ncbi:hypothetical protein Y032_0064g3484 [Ancylostoma ceylanicum]|uniref:Uncharacterized protein n=1 Tax=Ancylostoma ceylanicum TaxID=53326 RepID=A0A016U1G2_9BILA|nr:hypothetical protein Y032_0064g3484 [Ancylostoma ceylanicum]
MKTLKKDECHQQLILQVTAFAWFFLPIVIIVHVKVQEANRRRRIRGLVAIKASGYEGSRIYSTMLSQQWCDRHGNGGIRQSHNASEVNVVE